LLTGPKGMGKRWICKHAAHFLTLLGEKVELMVKFFGVSGDGRIWIDAASLPKALEQIKSATALIVHDVPLLHSSLFFSHLDFVCRMHRCTHTEKFEGSEQLPFGGLQLISTQDIIEGEVTEGEMDLITRLQKRVHSDVDPILFR